MAVGTAFGMEVVAAIAILILGWMVAGWAETSVGRALKKSERVDETLRRFFATATKYLVLAIAVIAVLNRFGVQTASLVALLGAAGLAIGLALQGTLGNVAAGVLLLILRPFKIGDFVEVSGLAGTVREISLFVTELATPDNVQIIVPNTQVWNTAVKNYSFHEIRRVDLVLGIGYDDSINSAIASITDVVKADSRILADPAPQIAVSELGDSSVNLVVRVWCTGADYWNVKFELTQALKERCERDGINIPYPHRTVQLVGQSDAAA